MQFFNPLNSENRRSATPEGHAGSSAHIYLPFSPYGYWYANGAQYTYLTGEIVQRASRPVQGLTRPNTFRKDASSCN